MMASFMSYFGGRKDAKQATRDAIVTLRQQLQMLEKKEEHLQKKVDEELKKARANAVTNKSGVHYRALLCTVCSESDAYVVSVVARSPSASRHCSTPAKESGRAGAGPSGGHTTAAGDAGQHSRVGELQPGDDGSDEEGIRRFEGNTWQSVRNLIPTSSHVYYIYCA